MNVYRSVTTLIALLLMLTMAQPLVAAAASATGTASSTPKLSEQIQQQSEDFNPDKLGKQMEQKATELQVVVVGGSKLYIILALVVFGLLLIGGLFFRRLLSAAFVFLALAFLGYLILNYWPQITDFLLSVLKWLFGKGGNASETSSGL